MKKKNITRKNSINKTLTIEEFLASAGVQMLHMP